MPPIQQDFSNFKIKEYTHWIVYLHEYQCYLGRVYILAKRTNNKDFISISTQEREEFFAIGKKINAALHLLFSPDKLNYAALGNVFDSLHVHFIPRYKAKRIFNGVEFIDARWGQNYAPYDKNFILSWSIMEKLKDALSKELDRLDSL